jgi:hypothetical protein
MSDRDDRDDRDEEASGHDAPSEPRRSEEGQRHADEEREETIDTGTDREQRADHPDADGAGDKTDTHGGTEPVGQRSTAPQSDFTIRKVGIGVAVLAVGLLVAFAIPLLLV